VPHPTTTTRAFLCTDIEGSSTLWELHPLAMRAALPRHHSLIDDAVARHRGRIFKRIGDGVLAVFDSVTAAINAAIDAQRAITTEPWQGLQRLPVRIAVHLGEADADGDDFIGPAVNRASRLCMAGHGGQILVSGIVARLARRQPAPPCTFTPLGVYHFRGLPDPESIEQVAAPDLPADFPALRATPQRSSNIPVEPTAFIGREDETAEIESLMRAARLVTLVGLGGTGKTRLALHLARRAEGAFPDGVWLVELAGITDPALIPGAIAQAVGSRESAGLAADLAVLEHLSTRHALIVLDNCEHLIDAVASLADDLLRACPQVRILATSRVPLDIAAEQMYRVPPLSLEASGNDLTQAEAVRLFIDRARLARPGLTLDADAARRAASICACLGAVPLAIVLATAQLRAMTIAELERLITREPLGLTSSDRLAPDRHRSIDASLRWSVARLSDTARRVLGRLAIFAGGCTRDAAAALCAGDIPESALHAAVTELVDASLVTFSEHHGESRYTLLETVRRFALQLDVSADGRSALATAHARYFAELARRAEPGLSGPEHAEWLARLQTEIDNLRAALNTFAGAGDHAALLGMAVALQRFWYERGHFSEGRRWLERALAVSGGDELLRGRAFNGLGNICRAQGDLKTAHDAFRRSLDIWQQRNDRRRIVSVTNNLGSLLRSAGDIDAARLLLEQAADNARAAGDDVGLAMVQMNLGGLHVVCSRYDEARTHLEPALQVLTTTGDAQSAASVMRYLAQIAVLTGRPDRAAELLHAAARTVGPLADPRAAAQTLELLAATAVAQGDERLAAGAFGAAIALREHAGAPAEEADLRSIGPLLVGMRSRAHDPALAEAWAGGTRIARRCADDLGQIVAKLISG